MDLNLLTALDALLRERNLTRAAAAVGVRQPAMSASLGRLRREFGDELLVRVGRGYELTPKARTLIEPVVSVLAQIDANARPAPPFDPSTAQRTFALRASDYIMVRLMAKLLDRVRHEAPGIVLRFEQPEVVESLDRAHDVDLWVLPVYAAAKSHGGVELLTERFVGAVAQDNTEVGDTVSLEQFGRLSHIRYRYAGFSTVADQHLDCLGIERHVVLTTSGFVTALMMLRGTPYITLVQEGLARDLTDAAGIRLVTPLWDGPSVTTKLHWRRQLDDDPGHRWLREVVVEVARSL